MNGLTDFAELSQDQGRMCTVSICVAVARRGLHHFDLELGRHIIDVIRSYMDDPDFASFVEEPLDTVFLPYVHSSLDDAEPVLLVSSAELDDLVETFDEMSLELQRG
jgi:hypothetical protein